MRLLQRFWKLFSRSERQAPASRAASSPLMRSGPIRVSVGLDFGTHGTKAVYFERGVGERVFHPVRFGHGLEDWPDYVLPAVGIVKVGRLVWGSDAARELADQPWNAGLRRLKAVVAGHGDPRFMTPDLAAGYSHALEQGGVDPAAWTPTSLTAAALALQIQEIHGHLRRAYPGRQIRASYTIPVPIDQVENSRVNPLFQRVSAIAEGLLTPEGTLRHAAEGLVEAAAELERSGPTGSGNGAVSIHTLPEAVAQMASYLTSLGKQKGLHGVIDVGAGTTDVSIFNLREGTERTHECYWYAAIAIPKAAAFVQGEVAKRCSADRALTERALLEECRVWPGVVADAFEQIRHASNPGWAGAHRHLNRQGPWEGCPVFLMGGGALLPGVGTTFRRCWVPNWPPHELRSLPAPRNYQGGDVPFERMSVAYGLSIPEPEHGAFILPNDAPDHTPVQSYRKVDDSGDGKLNPNANWLRK